MLDHSNNMTLNKKLAVIGFSGLSGSTQVGLNVLLNISIPSQEKFCIFYGRTESINSGYLEELNNLNIASEFVHKRTKGIDIAAEYKVFKSLLKINPKNLIVASKASIFGILFFKFFRPSANIITIEQNPLNLPSVQEYVTSLISLIFFNKTIPATESYEKGFSKLMSPTSKIFKQKIRVIPNGLLIRRNSDIVVSREKNIITLGMAARFDDVKDFSTVIKAVHLLNQRGGVRYKFLIAGDGQNRPTIEKLISELKAEEYVSLLGMLKKSELVNFYAKLDIYIQSTGGEAMSVSMMEAMGHGLPFIGSDVRGVQEFVSSGTNGILFKFGNIEDLTEKIDKVGSDSDYRSALSDGALKTYDKHFSLDKMVNEYHSLLK
jgi:glycosyltransferase involved in cell wall biosynthesis